MSQKVKRVLFYLFLLLACYLLALAAGGRSAAYIFVAAGLGAEVFFWRELLWRRSGD